MNESAAGVYKTKIGQLLIGGTDHEITEIRLLQNGEKNILLPSKLTDFAYAQISEYLEGERRGFTFPVKLSGTEFQLRVWKAIAEIAFGETVSYKKLAELAGSPNAVRAAASACGRNPVMIVVPCHRVVGTNNIGGFAYGTALKRVLLNIEGVHIFDSK